MLAPLKPLLCRHDFFWSERHRSDRCRRCGKLRAAEALEMLSGAASIGPLTPDAVPGFRPADGVYIDFEEPKPRPARAPATVRPSVRTLQAEAQARRDALPDLIDRLAAGARPSREEAIDAILAVMEDAHSADPLLFGAGAADLFARLHRARALSGG